MPNFEVPGATLYYETFGKGPLLLFIAGADGRGSVFHPVAELLSTEYTVICWDRRGYSRSFLRGPQDLENRLLVDADDADRLIRHIGASSTNNEAPAAATVFGTSSGAMVAMQVLLRHPDSVRQLIAHEPPAFGVLPVQFSEQGKALIQHIYNEYRTKGSIHAMEIFTAGLSAGDEAEVMRNCMNPERSDEIRANSLYWFEFELRQYPGAEVDVAGLASHATKFTPAAGVSSGDGPGVAPIAAIAQAVGKPLVRTAGGHIGYMIHPNEWVESFRNCFKSV